MRIISKQEQKQEQSSAEQITEFDVIIASPVDDDTVVVTGSDFNERIQSEVERKLQSALLEYDPTNKRYSAFLNEQSSNADNLTMERYYQLSEGAQSDLRKILEINDFVRFFVNSSDVIGIVMEMLDIHVNPDIRLSYSASERLVKDRKQKLNQLTKAKSLIEIFNKQVRLTKLLRTELPLSYLEANRVLYLRTVNDNYVIDTYPLSIVEIADYSINGHPAVLLNTKELINRLKKTIKKNRGGKAIFFENIEQELAANYPPEVLAGHKANEPYVLLDPNRCRVVRINNLGRRYGLSPFWKAIPHVLLLSELDDANRANGRKKRKLLVFQKLREKERDQRGFEDMAYSHQQLCASFATKRDAILYTGAPAVEDVKVVDTDADMVDEKVLNRYYSRILTALGVSFLNNESGMAVSTANMSIEILMNNVDRLGEAYEEVFEHYYKIVLEENGLPVELAPAMTILDSELLSDQMRRDFAKMLHMNFGASRSTTFEMLGLNLEDERAKREQENADGLNEIFLPYATSNTYSPSNDGENEVGRPLGDPGDKQDYDTEYNKIRE